MISAPVHDLAPGSRVVVAMSGGVDSSVVAALLHEHGCEVVGITLQLYDQVKPAAKARTCCAGQDIYDAKAVAERLGIAHYVLDFAARFRAAVIDDFADAYARGRTPIPCVRCNQRVKFADLLDIARDLGAAALATGHYARRVLGPAGAELHRAHDPSRDQSYFLFATTAQQLAFLRFPLGNLPKSETRALAARFGLAVADKPDSQDICFVPDGDHARIVGALRPEALASGEIAHVDGRVLGRHDGIARYTVGQRRGLGIAAAERLYVTAIDSGRHRITVGPRGAGACSGVELSEPSWLGDETAPDEPISVMLKHRYNEPAVPGTIRRDQDGALHVAFDTPQAGVAPGQACVAYQGTRLLGGGWIERTVPAIVRQAGGLTAVEPAPN